MDVKSAPRVLLAAAAVLALAGCAGSGGAETPTPRPSATETHAPSGPGIAPDDGGVYPLNPATHPHVQLSCPLISAVHYDPESIPAADVDGAYVCTTEPWAPALDGTPQLVQYVDRVAAEGIPALLAVYAEPDAERTDDNCIMSLQDPLIVWLHVGEHITPVFAPRDGCGFPTAAAAAAYAALDLNRLLVAREKETRD